MTTVQKSSSLINKQTNGCLDIKNPQSKSRLALNILSIVLGVLLFITAIVLSLSGAGLSPVLLCGLAVSGTAFFVAGVVATHARRHLNTLVSINTK